MVSLSDGLAPFRFSEQADRAIEVIRQLKVFKASSDSIYGIYLKFYDDDYLYSHTSSYSATVFFEQAAQFSTIAPQQLKQTFDEVDQLTILPSAVVSGYLFNTYGSPNTVIPVCMPLRYTSGTPYGTVMYLIDEKTFIRWVDSIFGNGIDLLMLNNDQVLWAQLNSGNNCTAEQLLQACTVGTEMTDTQWNNCHLLSMPGTVFSYSYVLAVPNTLTEMGITDSAKMLILVTAVLGALALVLTARLVLSHVRPIHVLYDMLSDRRPGGNELE